MRINHNIASLNTFNQLTKATNMASSALQKLSSGYAINTAADNAAGLAISEKMRSQIRGLDQASANSQDGISLVQTAEGNLGQTEDILQRMRELAVQSASDTNTDTDRASIQDEINQLKAEIDTISSDTAFNTKNLLDGTMGVNANVSGADNVNLVSVAVTNADLAEDTYTVTLASSAATLAVDPVTNSIGISSASFSLSSASTVSGLELGQYTLKVTEASGGTYEFTLYKDGASVASKTGVTLSAGKTMAGGVQLAGAGGTVFTVASGASTAAGALTFNLTASIAADGFSITNSTGNTIYTNTSAINISDANWQAGGFKFNVTTDMILSASAAEATTDLKVTNNAATIQIGANEGETMKIAIGKMDTAALGIADIDLSTKDGASAAITKLDKALEKVSAQRGALGAYQNRLDYTINNLNNTSQNLTSAESAIRDVDMAAEMAEYTKNNILVQAGTAMLAQANQLPQTVLSLLGG